MGFAVDIIFQTLLMSLLHVNTRCSCTLCVIMIRTTFMSTFDRSTSFGRMTNLTHLFESFSIDIIQPFDVYLPCSFFKVTLWNPDRTRVMYPNKCTFWKINFCCRSCIIIIIEQFDIRILLSRWHGVFLFYFCLRAKS